jgi:hypothetical protein
MYGQGGNVGTSCQSNKQCLDPYVCCGNVPEWRVCLSPGMCQEEYTPRMSMGTKAALVGVVAITGYLIYRVVK